MAGSIATAPRMLATELFARQAYWTSGVTGTLHLPRRRDTSRWIHPFWNVDETDPAIETAPVSGRGTVFTFTVNMQSYNPSVPPPYIIAIVELAEQSDLRIVTNIVGCDLRDISIGMPVQVEFEEHGAIFVPLFRPIATGRQG